MRRLKLVIALLLAVMATQVQHGFAQKKKEKTKTVSIYDLDTLVQPIPRQRELFNHYIDAAQKKIDLYDGIVDGKITYEGDELYSTLLTQALLRDVDQIQVMIENLPYAESDKFIANNEKIGFQRDLEGLLKKFLSDTKRDPVYYKKRVENFKAFLIARNKKELPEFFEANPTIYTFDNIGLLDEKAKVLKKDLLMKLGVSEPVLMIRRFGDFADEPYSGDVIAPAAKIVPNEVFNFASSGSYRYSSAIKRSSDPLVQTIVKISEQSKKPLLALPFLGDIHEGKKTIPEIDKIVADPDLFFKNLVRLKLENQTMAGNTSTAELQYRVNARYVRKINELHEEPDAVRFKILEDLTPEELYFIMVYGQDEIYTSSYLGAFKRMMERMKPTSGDTLLTRVHYDKFRTFIRMNAGYNTLSTFLATMNEEAKTKLMNDFVSNLEEGREDELEDAVDVADAFGSINDKDLSTFIRSKVKSGYERSVAARNPKGMKIYALLTTIFDGNEAALDLPPIKNVPYDKLIDDSAIVYQRVFFYGDEDGKTSYQSFLGNFKDGKWKSETNKYWTTLKSTIGKPVIIYANLPLAEPEDETAQDELDKFLMKENIHPTIIVHRGHSYHLPTTLDHLDDKTRVVVLGSCGGYHNLATVLDASPDAHIISSKQTGSMSVNDPILRAMNTTLLAGKTIDWTGMWGQLSAYFSSKSTTEQKLFSDYVPPYKNLGAIFIKAYRRLSAQENL